MSSSTSRFNILAVRGTRRLILHRSVPDLTLAVRIACDFGRIRPAKLAGLFISEVGSGTTWSVDDLVVRIAEADARNARGDEVVDVERKQADG